MYRTCRGGLESSIIKSWKKKIKKLDREEGSSIFKASKLILEWKGRQPIHDDDDYGLDDAVVGVEGVEIRIRDHITLVNLVKTRRTDI